jgi:hypothetical protein
MRRGFIGLVLNVALVTAAIAMPGSPARRADAADAPVARAFIANVAADVPVTEGPGSPELVVAAHLGRSTIDGRGSPTALTVYGDVHNGLDHPIANVRVSVTATWTGGSDTRTATLPVQNVPAGADAPFTVLMGALDDAQAQLSATVIGFDAIAADQSIRGLLVNLGSPEAPPIGPPDKVTGVVPLSDNLFAVSGVVGNTTDHAIRVDRVALAVYDGDGNVALVASTGAVTAAYPGPDPNVLAPGKSGTFTIYVPRATLLSVRGATITRGFVSAEPSP